MRSRWSRLERLLTAAALGLASIVAYHLARKIYVRYRQSSVARPPVAAEPGAAEPAKGDRGGGEAATFLPPILLNKTGRPKSKPGGKAPPPPKSRRDPQN